MEGFDLMSEKKIGASPFQGCYAKHLGGCNGKSQEHYISKSILETIGPFEIGGFPWLAPGEKRVVSANALTASILCDHHNSLLSDFDSEANKFISHLKLLDSKTTPDELREIAPVTRIDGIKLEKWLLKTMCGTLASGNYLIEGKGFGKISLSEYLVDLLFSNKPWKLGIGLYAEFGGRSQINTFRGIGYDPVIAKLGTHAQTVGIDVHFWGFPLRGLFATYEKHHPLKDHRPRGFHIVNGSITREIKFIWPLNSFTSDFRVFTRTGTIFPTA